jgi:hypothetical protein
VAPRPAQGPRPYAGFSLLRPTFAAARSWYDALQASARVRQWRGLTAQASDTWSHTLDHVTGLNIGGEPRPMLPVTIGDDASFERALAREKGDALFDARHRVVASAAYELPAFTSHGAALRHLAGGWQVNAIVQAQTGFALTVTEPVDVALQSLTNRPDVTCDPNASAPHTVAQWFDTGCFTRLTLPADAGRIGTPTFGQITSADDGRVVQVGVKWSWR